MANPTLCVDPKYPDGPQGSSAVMVLNLSSLQPPQYLPLASTVSRHLC